MKIKFPICDFRFSIVPAKHAGSNRRSRSGIALVITLILLSVTLVMALAFLAISRRESGSITTAGETATARLAADSALANAEAQAMANILSTTNPYNFGLLVSTNYINPNGFDPTITTNDLNNVNYDYLAGGGAVIGNNFLQNVANLFYLPRAPVYVPTNSLGAAEFRFYLDLNRNGKFDTNGDVGNFAPNNSGQIVFDGTTNFQVGDPEWIGVLEHPDQPHGPNNKFIARYAYIALPVGNGLDLNYIHDQTLNQSLGTSDGFFRNEGVGSWEINLAAFLADLNTNQWGQSIGPPSAFYQYNEPFNNNSGTAFDDARALLAYRYNDAYGTLALGPAAFLNDGIDEYSDGVLMTNTILPFDNDATTFWAGSDNTNHFFTPSDLFDTSKTTYGVSAANITSGNDFSGRLSNAGTGVSTYDRYTFYRLLSQLGTDSSAESGKMNLNYDNLTVTNGVASETNFLAWTPLGFFTNAADRMLRAYTANWVSQNFAAFTNTFGASTTNAFGITNIPVYVNGQFVYTPAVQRILQLAANIYDATTNNSVNGSPDYPDVFRPLFSRDANGAGTNVYITGYTNLNSASGVNTVSGPNDPQFLTPIDISLFSAAPGIFINVADNIYGVPWIIGAKKHFPNFNEFSMENNLAITRRLQVTRPTTNGAVVTSAVMSLFRTNQMYTMGLTSSLGVELWNSYAASYPGTIQITVNENASMMITNNDQGLHEWALQPFPTPFSTNIPVALWPGASPWFGGNPNAASFIPIVFTGPTLTNSVYRSSYYAGGTDLVPTNSIIGPVQYEPTSSDGNGFNFPQFGVLMTNRLQVFMLDLTNGIYHVIDYVHFAGPDSTFNVNANLADTDGVNSHGGVWDIAYPPGSAGTPMDPTYGILNQIAISKRGAPPTEDGSWQGDPDYPPASSQTQIAQQQSFFQAFFLPGNRTPINPVTTNLQLSVQAPYSPTRFIVQYLTWQANDPLVHYLASDIDYSFAANPTTTPQPGVAHYNAGQMFSGLTNLNLGFLNDRYTPWGGNPALAAEGQASPFDTNSYNSAERDPLAYSSDNWDFPTNKFPTSGWIGRVHRGTPWQTVYLKSTDILANGGIATWTNWTGNLNYFDATNSSPTQDRLLFDLFTTSPDDNATRGQLSVNVAAGSPDPAAGLAAWSALFSGIALPPVSSTNTYAVISPIGNQAVSNSALGILITNINYTRANFVNPGNLKGSFKHVGDILAVPQLTEQSPFLNLANTNFNSDEMYEWLPQQVMSLLRIGTPRYVIYSYGQTLKPAPNGIDTSSSLLPSGLNPFGMVTNYQIVSEVAARAVVRFDAVTNTVGTNNVVNYRAVIENYNILPPD